MKKILLLAVMALTFTSASLSQQESEATYVYVCTGPKAKRFHKTDDCRGLRRCSDEIKKITVTQAEEKGYTPCKICYR